MNHILQKCVSTFPKLLGKNKNALIKQWNENNFFNDGNEYAKSLFEAKQWSFYSDYARLKVLYEFGGIYLDTDIEVKKEIPSSFYEADLIFGYAYDHAVCTAFIMAKSHHPFIKHLLDKLSKFPKGSLEVNNGYVSQALMEYFPNFVLDGKYKEFSPNCYIYPRWYFDSATYKNEGGVTIHHGMGSWSHKNNKLYEIFRLCIKYLRFYCKPFCVWYMNRINTKLSNNPRSKLAQIYHVNVDKPFSK